MGERAPDHLRMAADLFTEKNKVYQDHYLKHGDVMAIIFPNGVRLRTARDHRRFFAFTMRLTKLMRYALSWEQPHTDSARDEMVYAAMQLEVDVPEREGA